MEKKSAVIFALALSLVVLGAGFAVAGDEPESAPQPAESTAGDGQESVAFAGMTVSIDPETGAFRAPTAEEAAVFAEAMRKMFAGAARAQESGVTERDGVLSARLGFEHMDFTVAHTGTDGKLHVGCVDDHTAATRLIETRAASPEEK